MANTPHCHRSSISNHPAKRRVNYCTFCHCHQQLCQALTRRPTTILLSFTTNQNPSKQLATPQIPFKHCNSIITIQLTLPILISSYLSKKKTLPILTILFQILEILGQIQPYLRCLQFVPHNTHCIFSSAVFRIYASFFFYCSLIILATAVGIYRVLS